MFQDTSNPNAGYLRAERLSAVTAGRKTSPLRWAHLFRF
jgi:hypothetical protein